MNKPDYEKCGGGKGALCCIFLCVGPRGLMCRRTTENASQVRVAAKDADWTAKRDPSAPYPDCMNQGGNKDGKT